MSAPRDRPRRGRGSRFTARISMADSKPITDSGVPSGGVAALFREVARRGLDAAGPLYASRYRIAATVVSVTLVVVGSVWFLLNQSKTSGHEKLQQALRLLGDPDNLDARNEAKSLAATLKRAGFRDPHFAGGAEFVLGIVEFRRARDADPGDREPHYLRASRLLRESERQALAERYRPEWSYALGVSLHELGNSAEALPLLQEAEQTFSSGRVDASIRLIEVLGDRDTAADLRSALKFADGLLQDGRLGRPQRDRVLLRKAQIHLLLNEHRAAEAALRRVSNANAGTQASRVFRARMSMATAEMLLSQYKSSGLPAAVSGVLRARAARYFAAGLADLSSLASSSGLATTFPRQARYLSGLCAQRIAELEARPGAAPNYDSAINLFGRAVQDYPNTHEAVAASLRAAHLLRLSGRSEEALQAFRRALRSGGRGRDVHNRWFSRREFRDALFRAWNAWMDERDYASAIELAGMMAPVVPETRARELHAVANLESARQLAKGLPAAPASKQPALVTQLIQRRRATGASYARYAELVKTTNRYSGALWTSAINFHAGHDFEAALRQYDAFLNTQPKERMAQALVRRGRVLMDLDRLAEAKEHFQRVREGYPENAARFEATYLLGTCYLELAEDDRAEAVWRGMLASPDLTPAAAEWRMSLFSLGRHLYHSAKVLKENADRAGTKQAVARRDRAVAMWRESILRLSEYEKRYPRSPETVPAQFLIAKAAQELAGVAREKRDAAEVENVRNQYRRRMDERLQQAEQRYRALQTRLLRDEEADRLNAMGRSYLRDCYFELAHTLYALERFDPAILAYTNAANRFPQDPQVLLAYLQMANCNERLGDPAEAMSLLLQAEVILKQLPDSAFNPRLTGLSRQQWRKWLAWARQSLKNRVVSTTTPPRLLPR